MPRYWHDRFSASKLGTEEDAEFNRTIAAEKKPYFMRYIYPDLMKKFNTFDKNTNRNSLREFEMTVNELLSMDHDKMTDRQKEFVKFYYYRMPVSFNNGVMNRICKRFEKEFDGYIGRHNAEVDFDYRIMRGDAEYTQRQYTQIKKLYEEYNRRIRNYEIISDSERTDKSSAQNAIYVMNEEFKKDCLAICPNSKSLCNIILDICYTKSSTKRFAWSMCGSDIIDNILYGNDMTIQYPEIDCNGDIYFCGNRFSMNSIRIEGDESDRSE